MTNMVKKRYKPLSQHKNRINKSVYILYDITFCLKLGIFRNIILKYPTLL